MIFAAARRAACDRPAGGGYLSCVGRQDAGSTQEVNRNLGETLDRSPRSDEQLAAAAAREGSDGPAFVELLRRYQVRVWRICYRLLGNEHDAHDAAQEVFVRLFSARAQFAGRSKYSTWVHGVAVRTSLNFRRGRGRREKRVAPTADDNLQQAATNSNPTHTALSLDLMQMLECLDEEDRAMLILKYGEDTSYEELAEIFHLSESACKMRISRAREKLKQKYPEGMKDE